VTTELGSLPPATRVRDERPEWAELIRLQAQTEIRRLVDRLTHAGIESRLRTSSVRRRGRPVRAVMVPRPELEDARFVLAQIAYESPSVGQSRIGLERILRWAAVGVTGAVLGACLLAGPGQTNEVRRGSQCEVEAALVVEGCR
jgi:hypothetical protein